MFKKLVSIFLISMLFVSCGSSKVNDLKLDVASKIKKSVKKELTEAFAEIEVEGVDCNIEAEKHSMYFYNKVVKLLRVNEGESVQGMVAANSSAKSVSSLQSACGFVFEKGFSYLIKRSGNSNLCLKKLGSVKLTDLGIKKVCKRIKI